MSSYATPADLTQLTLPATATKNLDAPTIQAALDAASATADGYMASSLLLPILPLPAYAGTGGSYPLDLKQAVCDIAGYRLMKRLGFKATGINDELKVAYNDALTWLRGVGAGKINPPGLIDSSGDSQGASGGPIVASEPQRGWQGALVTGTPQADQQDFVDSWD